MKNKTKTPSVTLKLCESAIMIALATILSMLKLVDLPYGGSITFASMLPILLIAYRHGTPWGLLTATVHGLMQFILGAGVLSYVTGWKSITAVILFDYVLAFALIGLGGLFRKIKSQSAGLVLGALIACIMRFACHFISGVTVWRDLSIPKDAAVIYSLAYNSTYMIPETLVLMLSALYIGSILNFSSPKLSPIKKERGKKLSAFSYIGGAIGLAALIFDTVCVFSKLQNADSGNFDITGLSDVNWTAVIIVSIAGALLSAIFAIIPVFCSKKD